MSRQILKYCLIDLNDTKWENEVEIPASATFKHVAIQNSPYGYGIMAWAEVITTEYPEKRKFVLYPTGATVPENAAYIGTFEYMSGTIWHLYEIKETK